MEQAFQRILTEIYHIVSKKALASEDNVQVRPWGGVWGSGMVLGGLPRWELLLTGAGGSCALGSWARGFFGGMVPAQLVNNNSS